MMMLEELGRLLLFFLNGFAAVALVYLFFFAAPQNETTVYRSDKLIYDRIGN